MSPVADRKETGRRRLVPVRTRADGPHIYEYFNDGSIRLLDRTFGVRFFQDQDMMDGYFTELAVEFTWRCALPGHGDWIRRVKNWK
jgi:hypothetical protein